MMYSGSVESLMGKFSAAVVKKPIQEDDFVDRLHYFVTVALLFGFAVAVGLQEYVGDPIDCWVPKGYHEEMFHGHINSYCWTHSLRYPKYEREAGDDADTDFFELSSSKPLIGIGTAFFRWAIILFVAQIVLFKIPIFLWRRLSSTSGEDLKKIRDLVVAAQATAGDNARKLKMDEVVAYFESWITGRKSYNFRFAGRRCGKILTCCLCLGKKTGNYLSTMYLLIKVLNLLNVLGNFILLASFLDVNFWKYGLVVINSIVRTGDWEDQYNFPRLLICDFVIEGNENPNNSGEMKEPNVYQLQCTVGINFLLEKIFIVEWFWLAFLFFITIFNIVAWAVKIKPPFSVIYFVKAYSRPLRAYSNVEKGFKSALAGSVESVSNLSKFSKKDFVVSYLKSDGVFVLQMLELNGDKSLVEDIVESLWNRYRATKRPGIDPGSIELSEINEKENDDEKIQVFGFDALVEDDDDAVDDDDREDDKGDEEFSGMEMEEGKSDLDKENGVTFLDETQTNGKADIKETSLDEKSRDSDS